MPRRKRPNPQSEENIRRIDTKPRAKKQTHEPVETVSSVRLMPNIDVIRPADPEETAGAFVAAMQRTDGPTLLSLTRQTVPMLNEIDVNLRREGVLRGGYIAKKETGKLELIILSCGSELQHALTAAKELGDGVRVVSMMWFPFLALAFNDFPSWRTAVTDVVGAASEPCCHSTWVAGISTSRPDITSGPDR